MINKKVNKLKSFSRYKENVILKEICKKSFLNAKLNANGIKVALD